ncbi:MAG TPA: helix-turn-helix domain-containing protein, partial [Limnochordia bacterium]|nr:helix-turn-helix domain-containing protein [Limnochordia bacterium]
LTQELAARVLKDTFAANRVVPITIARIQDVVADHYGIRPTEMKARKRTRAIAFPRQVAMYLARELTDASLPKIGEEFGGRDHSTVVHAHNKISEDLTRDFGLSATLRALTDQLRNGK